ncbi:hypothetical protein SEVIR_2G439550v4 [Setaria viridis]
MMSPFSLGWRRRRHLAGARRQRRQDLLLWLRRPAPPGCSTRGLLAVALLVARVPTPEAENWISTIRRAVVGVEANETLSQVFCRKACRAGEEVLAMVEVERHPGIECVVPRRRAGGWRFERRRPLAQVQLGSSSSASRGRRRVGQWHNAELCRR